MRYYSLFTALPLIICLLLLHENLHAQNSSQDTVFASNIDEIMRNKVQTEVTIVTSATKMEQSLAEAPNLLSIVRRRQIIDFGYISLNNLTWNLPGFSMSKDYDRNTISARGNYEGWNANHILKLIDGIPFNENMYGSAMTSEVTPLVFVKSVEVMRGAGSALYGTNAMNGLLNIKTISPADLKGNVEVRSRIATDGTQIYDAIAGVNDNRLSLVAAFNHYYTHGNVYESYDGSGRLDAAGNLRKFTIPDTRESSYFFAKADFKGKFSGLSFQYHEHLWNFKTGLGWAWQVPDKNEIMRENRRIMALTYKNPTTNKNLNYEFVLRYQNRGSDYNLHQLPTNAFLGTVQLPNGLSESVKTKVEDVFSRAQIGYQFNNKSLLLVGLENTFLYYGGDDLHESNVDLTNTFTPYPNGEFRRLNGFLEYMQHHILRNTGLFVQYISPKLIKQKFTITAGLRLDNQGFNYTEVYNPQRKVSSKSFTQLNPRLSLVYKATEKIYLKAMYGRAFRTPSPAEIFGANTYIVASNITQLQPESLESFEFSTDVNLNKQLFVRANTYYTIFDNAIGYSIQNNGLATNLYSTQTAGFEIETTYTHEKFTAFANYSFAKRLGETIVDTTISASKNLTWTPAHNFKIGATYRAGKFYTSLISYYQGVVQRRSSDIVPATFNNTTIDTQKYRPNEVAPFVNVDAKIGVNATKNLEFSLFVSNLLNTEAYLLKNFAYPMDYRIPQRMIMFDVKFVY